MREKIKTIGEIIKVVENHRADNERIVHCHGVFDLLHIGHIKHLKAARKLGNVLVVTITPDKFVNKGPHRPAFPEQLRAEALAELACVDFVVINDYPTAVEIITSLRPDLYVKGAVKVNGNKKRDHSDAIVIEQEAVESVGGEFILTDEETYSASGLINRFMDIFTPEANIFLDRFRQEYTVDKIVGYLQSIRDLKILTIGETIIDEYVFCDSMGKANKEAVLVVGHNYKETYAGGILAIANHTSNFCDDVAVVTALGEHESYEEFISKTLMDNVDKKFITRQGVPTLVKRRYVEEYLGSKLFEVYNTRSSPMDGEREKEFCEKLETLIPEYDVVIVADYGHGLLTEKAISIICDNAKFLAVNTQTNAENLGFNMISKYRRADYVAIAEPEVRLENRDLNEQLATLVEITAKKLSCPRFIVTRGKNGCLCYEEGKGSVRVPAFSVKMVDRIGSGDAFLAITSPVVSLGIPMEIVGFIGNVVGAEACAIIGNKSSIEPASLYRHLDSLMQ